MHMNMRGDDNPFPTRVGMNRGGTVAAGPVTPVPHTRGDEPADNGIAIFREIRSPHAWG